MGAWMILCGALFVSLLPLIPPSPDTTPASGSFSSQNAVRLIHEIAVEPRPMGSEGNRRGREKIANELRAMGLEPSTARLLTLGTAYGAARLALESSDSPAELRRKVSSPGGTTERAIAVFEEASMGDTLERGARASAERSKELAEILGRTQ